MSAPAATSLIDAVDEQDRPVGVVQRGRVFEEGANFRTVHILVFDPTGRLLLQRLGPRHPRHPGMLGSSVAGYLHAGECYDDAAVRRLQEELGLSGGTLRRLGRTPMKDRGCLKFIGVYAVRADPDQPRPQDLGHVASVEFLDIFELDRTLRARPDAFTETFRHVYRYWRRQGGREPR